jgi:nitroimidazol reductase NimA-like FMN-containing flavoprotein (pyridoxamine 5'-phosphate oxidase superfamily)
MRRKDREITDINEIISVMEKCDCCRIAFFDDEFPCIVPMNFGMSYDDNNIVLYFHCAGEGKKIDLIKSNPNVSFEMDCSHKLITGDVACNYSMEFESVVGTGVASFVMDNKIEALNYIMRKHSDADRFTYNEKYLKAVTIFKIDVKSITGKRKLK